MDIRSVQHGSPEHAAALDLRRRVLRDPLGIPWTTEEMDWERRERQLALFDDGELVACASVRSLGGGRVKVRQMAVDFHRQREGLGRALMRALEARLSSEGVVAMELHAREGALGFYERLGFHRTGQSFEEVGIPHWKMVRRLGTETS